MSDVVMSDFDANNSDTGTTNMVVGENTNNGERLRSFVVNLNHIGAGRFSQRRTEQTPLFSSVKNLVIPLW